MKAWIRIDEAQIRGCVEVHHPEGEIGAAAAATLTGHIVFFFVILTVVAFFGAMAVWVRRFETPRFQTNATRDTENACLYSKYA